MPQKPKTNRTSGVDKQGGVMDRCWTPWHGVAPLLPHLAAFALAQGKPSLRIWEPCAGESWLARWLQEEQHEVVQTDIENYGSDAVQIRNFLTDDPISTDYDMIVTNPPYSIKYQVLQRCYDLGKPFALLVPSDTVAAAKAARLYEQFGWNELRLKQRINFYMPETGFNNNGAQITTWWICSAGILPREIVYADLPKPRNEHKVIKPQQKPKEERIKHFGGAWVNHTFNLDEK